MKYKKLLFLTFFLTGFLLFFNNSEAFCQANNGEEIFEGLYEHWLSALGKFQSAPGMNRQEFDVFIKFSEKSIDSLRGDFMSKINSGKVTSANGKDYEDALEEAINKIYKEFGRIEQLYPSSIDEYRNYKPMTPAGCNSGCDNIDFEAGNLSGWSAYYAVNQSNTNSVITNVTGGLAGAVKHAANDVLTSTAPYFNAGSVGANPSPDYQINITSGNLHDAIIPSLPEVSPYGGKYSVMLGDSTQVNYGVAILSQTFLVSASNANLTYQYAVVLANPIHTYYQQPFFEIFILDQNNDTIPFCGEYKVVSGPGIKGFDSINNFVETYPDGNRSAPFIVYYKNWTIVNVPLTKYIGQCVTVVFQSVDCAAGGHFGYAYIDASCSPLEIQTTSPNFCGQDSITLIGPAGEGHYYWTGPNGGIRGSDTLREVNIDSAGTYTVVVTPFTGATCNDTLKIKIGKKVGTLPHPDFKADTGCADMSIPFLNISKPINGASFYWDFYDNWTFEDSAINATWNYNEPGVYQVRLEELYNGCGMDTVIKVVIDSISSSAFIADTVCVHDTMQFTNISTGGKTYYWNFGDPSSGVNNTSVITNPGHRFNAPGTYTVALIAKHPGWCNDTVKESVVVLSAPKPIITGSDSVCYASYTILSVSGGTSYLWSTGETTTSIRVSPTTPTIYTVTASNGRCFADTTFEVYIRPVINGTLTGKGTVCLGDMIVLDATGGGTYLWNTGATTSSISVSVNSFSDTAYSVVIQNGKSCIAIYKTINIDSLYGYACCNDTIFAGDSVYLNGEGAVKYYWIPPTGLSCDTCPDPIASPTTTTVYTLITTASNGCKKSSAILVDVEIPCRDFFIPNVFSPNGDGINDTYLIKAEYMSLYEISIYNRWGQELFHSTNPAAPWDGTVHGGQAPAGVYYYIVKATCFNGNFFHKQGFLQLIR